MKSGRSISPEKVIQSGIIMSFAVRLMKHWQSVEKVSDEYQAKVSSKPLPVVTRSDIATVVPAFESD